MIGKALHVPRHTTDERFFDSRRSAIKTIGLAGIGGGALLEQPGCAEPVESKLRASIQPTPHSAFRPGKRSSRFTVQRPVTDELVVAAYNNFYEFGTDKGRCWQEAQHLTVRPWEISIGGLVQRPMTIGIDDLIKKLPCEERLYRLRCVERWAMVVPWSGFPFLELMRLVEPLSAAKFVAFTSFMRPDEAVGQRPGSHWRWPYYEGLTIGEALNELCFVATGVYGHDLPRQHGAPLRMVVPWKYGYKSPKSIVGIEFVDKQPHTFWTDAAAHEYGFYSNVNPGRPHPRWSQKLETMIGTNVRHETQLYNGYGDFVAGLYRGDEF